MQIVRYQLNRETLFGYLAGDRVGPITGDIFGEFVRGRNKLPLSEVKLLAPCQPSKIVGVMNNFADRLRELNLPTPDLPAIFLKPPSTVIGPEEPIRLPPQSQRVEYSAELGVVMGKRARWVSPDEALQFVMGYACANDVTARDVVEQDGTPARGKSFDTFCPFGPCIATRLDPVELLITGYLNGEARQMSSTHDMLFTVPQVVAYVSSIMTLWPGDMILMGAPAGVGVMVEGDVIEVEIEGIGKLRNPVRAEER
jgi:2-keto-4-pentenoate hydratase/2-oxohepta-3-ene-1,7-dioic acid hydratase in catechol pathway